MRDTGSEDRLRRPARIRSVRVGELRVSYVPDGAVKMVPRSLFPTTSDGTWERNGPYLDASGWLTISAGGLLIEHGERAMLVDAGYGPFPEPVSMEEHGMASMYGGSLLESLAALGRRPHEIEAVAITHLHVEHLGWAAHPEPGSADPAFGHAQYLVSAREWEDRRTTFGVTEQVADALAPRVRVVADGDEVFPGVRAVALPGHTAGQMGYEVTSGDARLLAFADVLHSPVQVAHPDWAIVGEPAADASAALRRQVLARLADEDIVGFGIHFADVPFGRVRRDGDTFAWAPLDQEPQAEGPYAPSGNAADGA
ncbi:MBL fold metallo-hydrolase [Streptomyces sp. NHF165]|uniref:MBL fold metallo-hydrolase n=1 Tax=Streptomyces TaxID=1883 RepID=UPI00132ED7BB|nr:MBL fold metallo-hydrolase [Streptomyces sp. NHF165]QHF94595.1 MBL fold metallo-hydrolase [Streptomyces sp. NHF165]